MIAAAGPVIPEDFRHAGSGKSCEQRNPLFCVHWVRDNWAGTLRPALVEHVKLVLIALVIGFAISTVLAVVAHRKGWVERPVTWVTGFLFTIPSLALFQVLVPITGLTRTSAEIALVSYTLLILFTNTLVGLRGVPSEVVEAARGMGMTDNQILLRVELPLAVPAIIAGLRIAAVTVISLATVAVFITVESLGKPIFDAIQSGIFKTEIIAAGALAVALALVADGLLVLVQKFATPWSAAARRS